MRLTPHHAGIIVEDLERSKRFYAALGFVEAGEHADEDKTIAFMRLGEFQVEFFCYAQTPPASVASERVLGFRHLAFETEDIDEAFATLRDARVLPEDAAIRELPGGWRLLFFDDPDGIEIEIKQA